MENVNRPISCFFDMTHTWVPHKNTPVNPSSKLSLCEYVLRTINIHVDLHTYSWQLSVSIKMSTILSVI